MDQSVHQQRLSTLVCIVLISVRQYQVRTQGQIVGVVLVEGFTRQMKTRDERCLAGSLMITFIQLSVTFFSLDVNESDVKERSAPGVGLLHTRRPPDLTLHGSRCQSEPRPPLTVYHCQEVRRGLAGCFT